MRGGRSAVVFVLIWTALFAALAGSSPAVATSPTFSYVALEPGTLVEVNATTFELPVFGFYEPGGGPINGTATAQIAYDLKVEFVGNGAAPGVSWIPSNVAAGSFDLGFVLSQAQVASLAAGSGVVSLNATLLAPGGGSLAASGTVDAATLASANGPPTWWQTWFGATSPPPDTDSVSGIFASLAWLDATTTGRALYMLTTLVAVTLYLYQAHKLTKARLAAAREDRKG